MFELDWFVVVVVWSGMGNINFPIENGFIWIQFASLVLSPFVGLTLDLVVTTENMFFFYISEFMFATNWYPFIQTIFIQATDYKV